MIRYNFLLTFFFLLINFDFRCFPYVSKSNIFTCMSISDIKLFFIKYFINYTKNKTIMTECLFNNIFCFDGKFDLFPNARLNKPLKWSKYIFLLVFIYNVHFNMFKVLQNLR